MEKHLLKLQMLQRICIEYDEVSFHLDTKSKFIDATFFHKSSIKYRIFILEDIADIEVSNFYNSVKNYVKSIK